VLIPQGGGGSRKLEISATWALLALLFAAASQEVFEAAHVIHVGHAAFASSHESAETTQASASSATQASELLHHVLHLAFRLHHFLHLAELFEELVHLQNGGAGSLGNSLAMGGFDDDGAGAFALGHGEHDGFHLLDSLIVERAGGKLFFDLPEAGEHAEDAIERAEALDHFHLLEEVVEVELAGLHPLGGGHRLLLVDFLRDLLDHGDNVTHAEDAVGHAVGVEFGEVFHFLAFSNILDGLAGDGTHGEGGTAAGITIELGEDEAGDANLAIEGLGDGDRLLTGGGIGDEKGLAWGEKLVESLELVEEIGVELLSACGVENDDSAILFLGPFDGALGGLDEIGFARLGSEDGDIDLLGELGELVDGGGAIEIERDEKWAASFFLQPEGELGGGGGFTGTVEAAKEDVSGRVEIDGTLVSAKELGEFVLEDFDDLLAGFDGLQDLGALGFFFDAGDEVLDDAEFDIGLEKGETDIAEGVGNVLFGDFSDTPEVPEGFVEAVSEI